MSWRFLTGPGTIVATAIARLDPGLTIDEPDVSLTDFGLAVETAAFAAIIARQVTRQPGLRGWTVAFFGSAAVASLAGAIDHGFLRRDGREPAHDVMWVATLLAIGASSLALVGIGAELGLRPAAARRVIGFATVAMVGYALVVLFVWQEFLVAILAYAPAALFLLAVFIKRYVQKGDGGSIAGIAAVALAFLAAAIQRLEIGIHDRYLGHNALYHLIQAASFALLFVGLRLILARWDSSPDHQS
jgi:hypothetical protein